MSYRSVIYSNNAQRLMREEDLSRTDVESIINKKDNRETTDRHTIIATSEVNGKEVRVIYKAEPANVEDEKADALVLATTAFTPFVRS